ncbi:GNAT family N-acetyltransferase [Actinoplanes sp. CA-030573]|uniref:GNAT family N-acetyltransferase n=1 Tax=Actinoplanes sp. CA-030573 TaxID=3239898 RepID=UPI003D94FB7B
MRIETATRKEVLECVTDEADRRFFSDRLRRRALRRGRVYLAFDGSLVVGYVYLRLEDAEEADLRDRLPRTPLLQRLRVFPGYRRQGIGRELVAAAEEGARRKRRRSIALGVDEDEAEPIGFYLRIGYREWPHGLVETFKEERRDDGTWTRKTEYCRIFVKDLPRA